MGVKDRNVLPSAAVAKRTTEAFVNPPTNQAAVTFFIYSPGYKYQLTRVRSYCRVKAGTVTYSVKVGGRVAATGSFTTGTELGGTLSTTLANLRGSTSEAITIELTTDGTGALTDGRVFLEWRPFPMDGEAGAGDVV